MTVLDSTSPFVQEGMPFSSVSIGLVIAAVRLSPKGTQQESCVLGDLLSLSLSLQFAKRVHFPKGCLASKNNGML